MSTNNRSILTYKN